MFRVRFLDQAVKDLTRLDKPTAARLARRTRWLADNFERITPEALTGQLQGFYKLRVGDYRVVYEVLRDEGVLLIHLVGHRREVYRQT
jgi:mRNA interferase RelE/StbE